MICKGFAVSFDLEDGSKIDAPASFALLHDPTGRHWKKTSILIAPFHRDGVDVEPSSAAKAYLGSRHSTKQGDVDLPPRPLSAWDYEGDVEQIWYTRHGSKYGGRRFRHRFNSSGLQRLVRGVGRARLYSHGRLYRLELPRGAAVDDRGFLWP